MAFFATVKLVKKVEIAKTVLGNVGKNEDCAEITPQYRKQNMDRRFKLLALP